MIAIIAEKPSVGQDIARVVGATEKHTGYLQGNGYIVTWALGHLVGLALPEAYGRKHGAELPLIPDPFTLAVRKKRVGDKTATDSAAARQLTAIRRVLGQCTEVIAATDAGREGELIFRFIYSHLGCTLPVKRLWISSLTEEAIEAGMRNLKGGSHYDGLARAADCRAKADWLVGINASRALASASGDANSSLGRVQTPTLAMIASRYLENRGFLPSDYWTLHITLQKGDVLRKFRYVDEIRDKAKAEALLTQIKAQSQAAVDSVEKKWIQDAPPLLYDLTTLQKECNVFYDMPAEKTLNAAQSLYEKKLISYPRTGSRYIPQDMMRHIPSLLRMALRMEQFAHFAGGIDPLRSSQRPVDDEKVTDHHALIITGDYARELTAAEEKVYHLIAGRMLEAFAPRCEKETMLVEATIGDMLFRSRSVEVVSPGWRGVYNRPEERGEEDDDIHAAGVEFTGGEALPVMGYSLAQGKTRPKPLYTEATLLSAMETAGKRIEDEKAREAIRDPGIGTPATRAAVIETLIMRQYVERSGKSLIPTAKGLQLYKAVKDLRIADAELTGSWEKSLAGIERGAMSADTFMKAIDIYTRQITAEVLSLDVKQLQADPIRCPKCRSGNMTIRHRIARCGNDKCGLAVYRRFLNKELTDLHMGQLLSTGKTKLIKGFKGKQDKTFDARLKFDRHYNLTFEFPAKNAGTKKKAAPAGRAKPKKSSKGE